MALAVVVVVAGHIRIGCEHARQQCADLKVCLTIRSGKYRNARIHQRCARAGADAAADQDADTLLLQKFRKRAVAAAVGVDDLHIGDAVILDRVNLKLLGVAEMLENLSVFIGCCNFYVVFFLLVRNSAIWSMRPQHAALCPQQPGSLRRHRA